ncbi:hypothetical protein ACFL9T_16885 [Thermodesulfobacteriota bacterium]
MPEHSIEFLGQKFSYPTTWQGSFSVLIVCISISFIAFTLSPEQIKSYSAWFGSESDKKFEGDLVSINQKLSDDVSSLKAEVLRLTKAADIPEPKKKEIVKKIEASDKKLNDAFAAIIEKQIERKDSISAAIPRSGQQQQRILTIEKARLDKQIGELQQQQQQQQKR